VSHGLPLAALASKDAARNKMVTEIERCAAQRAGLPVDLCDGPSQALSCWRCFEWQILPVINRRS
ncbi:MAG TPA: hypothetical protein VGV87_16550, partial [Blastocatellia bacterium]|nr:hypothetical protein [Blastocatellia bacterium]